jgi:hypothetical protein
MTTTGLARRVFSHLALLPASPPLIAASSRNLLRTGPSPSVAATKGTRSPSTVPGRVPALPAPTSLRTVALAQASCAPVEEPQEDKATALSVGELVKVPIEAPPTANAQMSLSSHITRFHSPSRKAP